MTIQADFYAVADYGNGATTTFGLPWPFRAQSDVIVQLLDTTGKPVVPAPVLNGGGTYDFTITGTADPDTGFYPSGNVVFNTAPPTGYTAYRSRATKDWQDKSMPSNGRLPAKSIEAALDRRTLVDQEQDYLLGHLGGTGGGGGPSNGRIVMMSPYDLSTFSPTLPPTAGSAGFVLAQKADGSGFQWVDLSGGGTTLLKVQGTANQITASAISPAGIVTLSLPSVVGITGTTAGFGSASFAAASTSTTGVPAIYVQNDAGKIFSLQLNGSAVAASGLTRPGGAMLYTDGPGGLTFQVNAPQPIYFGIQGAEVARFDSNGRFGIGGLVAPAAPFDLTMNQNSALTMVINNTNAGAAVAEQIRLTNNQSNATMDLMALGAAYTPSALYKASQGVVVTYGVGGLLLNNLAAAPIQFGINNLLTMNLDRVTGLSLYSGYVDIWQGYSQRSIVMGADANLNTRSANTRKMALISIPSYASAIIYNQVLMVDCQAAQSVINYGGGGGDNTVTSHIFWVAPNVTTSPGTNIMVIGNSGIGMGGAISGGWGGAMLSIQRSDTIMQFSGYYTGAANGSVAIFDARMDTSPGNYYMFFRYGAGGIGNITTASGTTITINGTSDVRLKKNIKPAADPGKIIDAIEVCQFDWRLNDSHTSYGIVAQALHEVFPEAVTPGIDDDDPMKHIPWMSDVTKLVPLLLAEVQHLRRRLKKVETKH